MVLYEESPEGDFTQTKGGEIFNAEVTGDLGESTLSEMAGEKAKLQWVESECVVWKRKKWMQTAL